MKFLERFAAPVWQLSIFPNRIVLRDGKSGQTWERDAEHPFSDDRHLITDDQLLEREVYLLARQVTQGKWQIKYPVLEVVALAWSLSPDEVDRLKTALANAGASRIILPTHLT